MNLVETYARVRRGIVAFVPRFPDKHPALFPPGATHFETVFGTGFIVGDSLIATNAHVGRLFDRLRNAETNDLEVSAIVFICTKAGMGTLLLNVTNCCCIDKIMPGGFYYGTGAPDLALVSVNCTGLSELALTLDTASVPEGTAIATAGFPMGSALLHADGQLHHIAPTLQTGVISATLPFPEAIPHGYLVNIMVQEGASGSPVFLTQTGEVIGVIYARHYQDAMRPTNFSYVVPSHFLDRTIKATEPTLMTFVAPDAPTLCDILAHIPTEATQKITQGLYHHGKSSGPPQPHSTSGAPMPERIDRD